MPYTPPSGSSVTIQFGTYVLYTAPVAPTSAGPIITAGQGYFTPAEIAQSVESTEELYDNLIVDRTTGGIIKVRSLVPVEHMGKIFNVVHPAITLEQKNLIQEFYKVNRDHVFDFIWAADGETYTVAHIGVPKVSIVGGTWWKAEVPLAEYDGSYIY